MREELTRNNIHRNQTWFNPIHAFFGFVILNLVCSSIVLAQQDRSFQTENLLQNITAQADQAHQKIQQQIRAELISEPETFIFQFNREHIINQEALVIQAHDSKAGVKANVPVDPNCTPKRKTS